MNITNAGVRGHNPTGVVIHNDAGSNGANAGFYNNWLPTHNPEMALLMFILEMTEDCRLLTSQIRHGIALTHTVMQTMQVGKCASQRAI